MTDLTLNEYRGLSGEELARVLKEEAYKISENDSHQNCLGKNSAPQKYHNIFKLLTVYQKMFSGRAEKIGLGY